MAKKTKKPTNPDLKAILITGLVDLVVGTLLLLISKIID